MSSHQLDQAVLTLTFLELAADPVEPARYLPAIVGVLVAVESLKDEAPFIRAEVNGLSGCRVCHEWVACASLIVLVRFYQWSQASSGLRSNQPKPYQP
jgi:hypothetical protein